MEYKFYYLWGQVFGPRPNCSECQGSYNFGWTVTFLNPAVPGMGEMKYATSNCWLFRYPPYVYIYTYWHMRSHAHTQHTHNFLFCRHSLQIISYIIHGPPWFRGGRNFGTGDRCQVLRFWRITEWFPGYPVMNRFVQQRFHITHNISANCWISQHTPGRNFFYNA